MLKLVLLLLLVKNIDSGAICEAGWYSLAVFYDGWDPIEWWCYECGPNQYALAGSDYCTDCPVGRSCDPKTGDPIIACLLGSDCSPITVGYMNLCPAGRYLVSSGGVNYAWSCVACEPGSYRAVSTNKMASELGCETCPVGTCMFDRGATQCNSCSTTYPAVGDTCVVWTRYTTLFFPSGPACGVTKTTTEKYCTYGRYYKVFPRMVGCNYLNEIQLTASCPNGVGCMVCSAGDYQPDTTLNSLRCLKCPAGTFSPYTGSMGPCNQCPSRYYCPYAGLAYPLDCPQNMYSGGGYSQCAKCTSVPENGYITGNGASATSCAFKCNAGFYKTSTPSCAPCGFGRHSTIDLADGSICDPCPYSSITGTACKAGEYATFSAITCAITKCTACTNIPAGSYFYSTTNDQTYYVTASITTEVSVLGIAILL